MKTIPGASHREDLPVPVPEAAYIGRLPGYLCLLFLYQNNNGNDQIAAVSAMGYDAYFVALEAIKAAGSTDPADVLAALPNVVYENGVCGTVKFNENGDAEKNEAVVKHCNTETGEWEYVKTQSIEE